MMYLNEGANMDICIEFNKLRLDVLHDRIEFKTAITAKDYKTARAAAYRINKSCDDFYNKLEHMNIDKTTAVIGTAVKTTYDIALVIAALFVAVEAAIKTIEVTNDTDFSKSNKEKVRKVARKALFSKDVKFKTASMLVGAAIEGSIRILAEVKKKLEKSEKVEPKDLDAYYVVVKQKMKIICAKAKLLTNEVDILEERKGAIEKRKELEQNVKDAKDIFKEREEYTVDKDLMEKADAKNVKESVDVDILSIYEACQEGIITEEERDDLILNLRNARAAVKVTEEVETNESAVDMSLKEKYNEVKRLVYEKCASGELSEANREAILKEAYNKIFNVDESVSPDVANKTAAAPVENKNEEAEAKKDLDEMNKNIDKELDNK